MTPQAGRLALEEVADRSYEQSVSHLRHNHSLRVGKELLENMTRTVGQYWIDNDHKRWDDYSHLRKGIAPLVRRPQRCCVFADGVMAHVDGSWRQVLVGTVRSDESDGNEHKFSLARMTDTKSFGQLLLYQALEYGYGRAEQRAFIADGAHWIWRMADKYFSKSIQILDFYHVCEHVESCGKEFFTQDDERGQSWPKHVLGLLRAGLVDEAILEIRPLNPGSSKAKGKAKHELLTYLHNNRNRMDYPRYEQLGLPIGSGEVEAQCKTLVQQRCKQSGMRWSRRGIEVVLRIRSSVRAGRYRGEFFKENAGLLRWRHKKQLCKSRAA